MRRAAIVGLSIGAVAVVAAGVGIAIWASDRSPSASDVAMTYFSALSAGDAAGALAVTTLSEDESREIEAAYAAATERVADARVISATDQPDTSHVVVSYTLAGRQLEGGLELAKDASGWRIVDGVAAITPRTNIGDAVGFGAIVALADSAISLLPGRYEPQALPRGLVLGSTTVDAAPGIDAEVAVAASVSPDATAAAQSQLDAYVQTCTVPAAAVPDNCGIRVPWAADLAVATSFAFRVDQQPTVSLSPDAGTFAATDGVLVATVSGTTRDGAPASVTYRASDWALRGTVTFQGNEMVLAIG